MQTKVRWILAGGMALAALGVAAIGGGSPDAAAAPGGGSTSTVSDPVGDMYYNAPAYRDIVGGRLTRTARGNFELLMEMAGAVPDRPSLLPLGHSEIWWFWSFDLDPAASPQGYPTAPGYASPVGSEFSVYVSWDGTDFVGIAVDRRPQLSGGDAIVTRIPFRIDGTVVRADLPSALIGDVPASFVWSARTIDWAGPLGSVGHSVIDTAQAVFTR